MILRNTDEMSTTPVIGYANGIVGGRCVSRAVDMRRRHGLEIEFGQVMVFDRRNKMWVGIYGHHFWNYDKDDNLYDSYSLIDFAYGNYTNGEKLIGRKCLEVDGDKFRWLKEEPTNDTYKYQEVYRYLNKHYRDNKIADLIYVRNHGYTMPPEYQLMNWDMAQERIEAAEADSDGEVQPEIIFMDEFN